MYVCVYVCMYLCLYVCMSTIFIHIYIYSADVYPASVYAYIYICICIHVYVHERYVHICIYMHIFVYFFMFATCLLHCYMVFVALGETFILGKKSSASIWGLVLLQAFWVSCYQLSAQSNKAINRQSIGNKSAIHVYVYIYIYMCIYIHRFI